MKNRSEGITRLTVDMTANQRRAVDAMIQHVSQQASDAAGVPIRIGVRQFFHMLLKRYAVEMGVAWPDDYPPPGGQRDSPPA